MEEGRGNNRHAAECEVSAHLKRKILSLYIPVKNVHYEEAEEW